MESLGEIVRKLRKEKELCINWKKLGPGYIVSSFADRSVLLRCGLDEENALDDLS